MNAQNTQKNLLTIALFVVCVSFAPCEAWSEEQDHDHAGHAHDEPKTDKSKPDHTDSKGEHDDHDHAQEDEVKSKGAEDTHEKHGEDNHEHPKDKAKPRSHGPRS